MQKLKMSFFHLLESLFTCFLKDKTLHNHWDSAGFTVPIITYQVITGNYSQMTQVRHTVPIITYQVITENYTPGLGLSGKAAKSTPFLCNHFAPHFAIKSLGSSPNNPITTQSEPFGFS